MFSEPKLLRVNLACCSVQVCFADTVGWVDGGLCLLQPSIHAVGVLKMKREEPACVAGSVLTEKKRTAFVAWITTESSSVLVRLCVESISSSALNPLKPVETTKEVANRNKLFH